MRYLSFVLLLLVTLGACSNQAPEPGAGQATAKPGALPAPVKPGPPVQPAPVTLPEGTVLKVRTTTTLSTKTNQPGETFTATLAEPVVEEGRVIAAKGAQVEGRIAESDKGGRIEGRAEIAVRLTRIHTAGGGSVEITTTTVAREAASTKRQDATKIGIGSGVGAAIGAIAGGGKGAAIGAAAGAGAGTGYVLATHGNPAVIPAESLLSFKLRSTVTIPEAR